MCLFKMLRSLRWPLAFWMSFALMLACEDLLSLHRRGIHEFSFWLLLLGQTGDCLTLAFLTPPVFFFVRRYPVTKGPLALRSLVYLLGSAVFIVAFACVRWTILPPWSNSEHQFLPRTFQNLVSLTYTFADQIWTYLATVVAAHLYTSVQEKLELQKALAVSELETLKSQIHPHFLFNTLHGISALIDYDKDKARSMIRMLSNLLRAALKHGQADMVPLREELNLIEDYLVIEKVRFGDRLEVRWDVTPETGGLLVPQLILQPLVENAIVHGIACCREGGWLQIVSRRKGDSLEVQISNSMCGKRYGGMGVGIQNTRGRLKYLYGDDARFEFVTHGDHFATATLNIPTFHSLQTRPARLEKEPLAMMEGRDARPDRG